jgi:gliding motility-associated-like protein
MRLILALTFLLTNFFVHAQHNYTHAVCDTGVSAPTSLLAEGNYPFKFSFVNKLASFYVRLFDENGNEVYTSSNSEQCWTGLNKKGEKCGPGNYYWIVTYSYKPGELQKSCIGTVKLYSPEPCEETVVVPNVFGGCSGDSANDMFLARFGCVPEEFTMWIFDRWGNLIFENSDLDQGWSGRSKNGSLAIQDVYVWKIKCKFKKDGPEKSYVGHVTLIR